MKALGYLGLLPGSEDLAGDDVDGYQRSNHTPFPGPRSLAVSHDQTSFSLVAMS